jgi:exo-beta-1,3-glucanase (GH17 family)
MKKLNIILVFITAFAFDICLAQNVQVNGGWFYINGNKFFVKGIGYETHTRPGQVPWVYSFNADLIRFDLQRIKSAGFNTIRTWSAITEEELKLVEESGLKILFGIWIDPSGDFGSQSFRISVLNHVNSVLSYSSKYRCVIGYLIMNEPQVAHIYSSDAQKLFNLWQSVTELIHQKHYGIPVSFSNTIIGDYINMDIFNFAAYNAYIYNPVTITDSHGYQGFLSYLKNNRANQKPFVITEFGLSVSPGFSSTKYTYGGNTLEKQTSGDLLMYRALIDAGTQGGCVFQYHDGWWKGGSEFFHDSSPEEWFGLIEFTGQNDLYGSPRLVWSAFEKYNKAIITDPKNEEIYSGKIPVEIFTTEDINSFSITLTDSVLINQNISNNYFNGLLDLNLNEDIKDVQLTFNFYNAVGDTIKSETISFLRTRNEIQIPQIKMQIVPTDLNPGSKNYMLLEITSNSIFTIEGNKVNYVVHPHIGFDAGTAKSQTITLVNNKYSTQDFFDIPKETKVTTFGAGFTIRHGIFTKRIFTQKILTYGNWANSIKATDVITDVDEYKDDKREMIHGIKLYQNYPNPFNPETTIIYTIAPPILPKGKASVLVNLKVYDVLGREVAVLVNEEQKAGTHYSKFFNINSSLAGGVYFCRLIVGNYSETTKMIILK